MSSQNIRIPMHTVLPLARVITVLSLLALLLAATALHAQANRAQLSEALGIDLPPAVIPVEKEITALDLQAGRIYLDEEGFSLALFVEGDRDLNVPLLPAGVDLKTLSIGDKVLVETDGTAPSSSHYPLVISIAKVR